MQISRTLWLPVITDWWRQQEETQTKYANLSNVVRDIFCIIPYAVGVEASFSLGPDVIGWGQSETTGETLRDTVVVRQFARANNWPRIGYNKHGTRLRNEERGAEQEIAQTVQGSWLFRDVPGQPKPMCYPERIPRRKQSDDCCGIDVEHRRDRQCIVVTLFTWWCGCIHIVRKISFATTFVCKETPCRLNSNIEWPPNPENQLASVRKWWG